jgi:hypothetical protein
MVEVTILPLSPLAIDIFSPGDLFDELNATTEFLFLQARGMEGSCKDTEDVIAFKIPHHIVTLTRPYMSPFHHQLEVHPLPRPFFLTAIITEED